MISSYCQLARDSIRHYLQTGEMMKVPKGVEKEALTEKHGVFVSLHLKENNNLR